MSSGLRILLIINRVEHHGQSAQLATVLLDGQLKAIAHVSTQGAARAGQGGQKADLEIVGRVRAHHAGAARREGQGCVYQ